MIKDFNILTRTKGQVTVFILIGLVILIIFALLFYLLGIRQEIKNESYLQTVTSDVLRYSGINSYVEGCLADSLQKGLLLIGRQGGNIYPDQEFSMLQASPHFAQFGADRVAYFTTRLNTIWPPQYPCTDMSQPAENCKFTNTGASHPYTFGYPRVPSLIPFGALPSIITQLEYYVANKTRECADFENFIAESQLAGYNISETQPIVEIIPAENDITAIMTYPIQVRPLQREPVKHLLRFYARVPVRLLRLHSSIEEAVYKDNTDLNYLFVQNTSHGIYGLMELEFNKIRQNTSIREIQIANGDSIIIFNDTASRAGSQDSYSIQFARQNRPPVLDHIPEQVINVTPAGFTHYVNISAADPDDTEVTFSYLSYWPVTVTAGLQGRMQKSASSYYDTFFVTGTEASIGNHLTDFIVTDSFSPPDWQQVSFWVCNQSNNVGMLPDICIAKCGAHPVCDRQGIGTVLGTCVESAPFADMCGAKCGRVASNICRANANCNSAYECDGITAYNITPDLGGWCNGYSGCEDLCTGPIRDDEILSPPYQFLNSSFDCGCAQGAYCDSPPYNLNFNGLCSGAVCQNDD